MVRRHAELRVEIWKEGREHVDKIPVNHLHGVAVNLEFSAGYQSGAEGVGILPSGAGRCIADASSGEEELRLGVEPVVEPDLDRRAEEEIAHGEGAEVEREALAESGGAAKGNLLHDGRKWHHTALRVAGEPGSLGGERKEIIILDVTAGEVQQGDNVSARFDRGREGRGVVGGLNVAGDIGSSGIVCREFLGLREELGICGELRGICGHLAAGTALLL
jgi:hypothetical protein